MGSVYRDECDEKRDVKCGGKFGRPCGQIRKLHNVGAEGFATPEGFGGLSQAPPLPAKFPTIADVPPEKISQISCELSMVLYTPT